MAKEEGAPPERRSWGLRLARGAAIAVAGLVALVLAAVLVLDTSPGRRLVADAVRGLEFENGMRIAIGRIDGSLYGRLVLHDVSVKDPKGEFLYLPRAETEWRPRSYFDNRLDIRSAEAERMFLRRLPEFRETDSDAPLLPEFDISIGSLEIGRVIIEKPVTGERRIATLVGNADITDGRAIIGLGARTLAVEGGGGGDRLVLQLDAVPEQDRFSLDAKLDAPADGVLAAMTGLQAPLALTASGKGTWSRWNGSLAANSGDEKIARLKLAARDGEFTLKGPARLNALTASPIELLAGQTMFDVSARLEDGAARLAGNIVNSALRLAVDGTVDLPGNRFENLNLAFDVLRPSTLNPELRASGLGGTLRLDGDFRSPAIRYALNAASLDYGEIGVRQLAASGDASIGEDGRIRVPVTARAQRITGFDEATGGPIQAVRLTGDVTVDGNRMLGENILLVSNRFDARALMIANLETGRVSGTLDGTMAGYRLESVAILDIGADTRFEAGGAGGLALTGRIRARSKTLLNDGLRQVLGGNFAAAGDMRYAGDAVRLSNVRLTSPDLTIVRGEGVFTADGGTIFDADATSRRYGKVALRLRGSLSDPDAVITAERPGLGIGLAGLEARITGISDGFGLSVTGDTDYGPLRADIALGTRGATELRINRAELAGVGFTGSIRQTAQGPFSGTLRANGNGLGGIVRLGSEGRYQSATFRLRSTGSVFPGKAGLSIGSAIIDGRVVLYDSPHIVADIQLADTQVRGFDIAGARVNIDYRNGSGQAKALIEADSGVPFRLAANARLAPDMWTVALKGRSRGIAFATAGPARIRLDGDTYQLLPSRISIGSGAMRLSGSYGDAIRLKALLEDVDLAPVNAFIPGFGAGGRATGSLDFAQAGDAALPRIDAKLKIDSFTRSTALAVSQPVDVTLAGQLRAERGEVKALLRTGGGVVGRVQVFLAPGGGGDWQTRVANSGLSGGLRFNGPADTLLSLAGQPGQRINGNVAIAADLSCRVDDPCLTGIVRGSGMTFEDRQYGTRLSDIAIDGRFSQDRLLIEKLSANAGSGSVQASGEVSLSASKGYPMDLAVAFDRARLARSDTISATATGELRLTKAAGQSAILKGSLRLPEARFQIVRENASQVAQLNGVRFLPPKGRRRITGDEAPVAVASLFEELRLDIDVSAPNELFVSGMGLESEWVADFRLLGTPTDPRLAGNFTLQRGTLGFAGRSFELTRGRITFTGGSVSNPELAITATEDVDDLTVTVNVTGRAENPQIAFASVPGLPEDEIMSRILFGRSIANLGALQAVQLAASLNTLRGSGGGTNPLGKLRSASGIDRLRIIGADEETGRGTSIAAGQHITDNVYVELITDARGFTATQLEVSLTPWLSVLSQAGGSGVNSLDVRIKKDY